MANLETFWATTKHELQLGYELRFIVVVGEPKFFNKTIQKHIFIHLYLPMVSFILSTLKMYTDRT